MHTHIPWCDIRIVIDNGYVLQRNTKFFGHDQVDNRVNALTNFRGSGDHRNAGVIIDLQYRAATIGFMNLGATCIMYGGGQSNTFFVTAFLLSCQSKLVVFTGVIAGLCCRTEAFGQGAFPEKRLLWCGFTGFLSILQMEIYRVHVQAFGQHVHLLGRGERSLDIAITTE